MPFVYGKNSFDRVGRVFIILQEAFFMHLLPDLETVKKRSRRGSATLSPSVVKFYPTSVLLLESILKSEKWGRCIFLDLPRSWSLPV